MSVENLPCDDFDLESEVVESHDVDTVSDIAQNMMNFIAGEAKKVSCRINS